MEAAFKKTYVSLRGHIRRVSWPPSLRSQRKHLSPTLLLQNPDILLVREGRAAQAETLLWESFITPSLTTVRCQISTKMSENIQITKVKQSDTSQWENTG